MIREGINDSKIFLIGQGINIENIQGGSKDRFRKRFNIKEPKIVFHVSAKSYDKGSTHVVEAMKKIWERNKGVRLVLAGAPMDEFNRFFSGQGDFVKKKTTALDYVSPADKKDLFAAGDVFVLPSRTDSFGIVFLEAWVNKKPVIGARAGGIPEVIKHREDGFLAKFGNIDEIAFYIETLLYDENLAKRMAEQGFLKVCRRFTWDMKYKEIARVFSIAAHRKV